MCLYHSDPTNQDMFIIIYISLVLQTDPSMLITLDSNVLYMM